MVVWTINLRQLLTKAVHCIKFVTDSQHSCYNVYYVVRTIRTLAVSVSLSCHCEHLYRTLISRKPLSVLVVLVSCKHKNMFSNRRRAASVTLGLRSFLLSVPLLVVIWSYPGKGYKLATGHFVWLVWSPGTVYHWTFVRHLHYQRSKTFSRHICSLVPTSLTNCFQSTSSEHCTAAL